MPLKWNTFISFSANNASAMTEIIQKNPPKAFWILLKHWNVISFRATADTLHVQLPVTRIGKPSKQLVSVNFYTLQVVYNSQLLMFCSTQIPTTVFGYATNWNSTSWEEIYPQQSKFSANFLQAMPWCL
jgi:hypothetical protein